MPVRHVYKVIFQNRDRLYEIYARKLSQGLLFGFIEIEGLAFGERSKVVVDPGAEKLATEFEGVQRVYIPLHSVVRIDEVAHEGTAKITEIKDGNVTPFPVYTPGKRET